MKDKNLIIFVSILLLTTGVFAQKFEWLPGSTYDPSIPTPVSVLGYEIGTYITEHHQMVKYMNRLAASSDKVQIVKYGQSYERRAENSS